jgi:hypothetical protein
VFVQGNEATVEAKKAFQLTSKELAKRFGNPRLEPWTEQRVVDSVPSSKRAIYTTAMESLLVKGLDHKDSRVSMFVKPDKLTDVGNEPKKPRAIQGRSPRFNVLYGKYIKPIEHFLSGWKGVRRGVPRTRVFAKGLDWTQRAKLVRHKLKNFKYCYSLDASAFDASVRVWHLLGTHRVYKALVGCDSEFLELLNETLVNTGLTKHGTRYTIVGNRMSGDMDTGIGNSLLAFLLIWTVMRRLGLRKWDLLCDGDDILVFSDVYIPEEAWGHLGAQLGFTWKMESIWQRGDPLENIEFCRHRLVCVAGTWRFVRGARALATFGVTHVHTNIRAHRRYLKGVAMAEMHASSGVPCSSVLSARVYEKLKNEKELFVHSDLFKFGSYVDPKTITNFANTFKYSGEVDVSTRLSYEKAFGVSVGDQIRYESDVPKVVEEYLTNDRTNGVDALVDGDLHMWLYPELHVCVL